MKLETNQSHTDAANTLLADIRDNTKLLHAAETAWAIRRRAISTSHRFGDTLRVLVVGAGPAGLLFACSLAEKLHEKAGITVFDGRLTLRQGKVTWKGQEEGVNRREQVVTIQSLVSSRMPTAVANSLFPEGGYSEMWPTGGESPPALGPPRNIRIRDVEDRLLAYALDAGIDVRPGRVEADRIDLDDFDLVVIADGPRSQVRDAFIDKFGKADPQHFAVDGDQVTDVVLGLRGTSNLPDPDAAILTLSQQRFLMNAIKGDGYLYMRLTPDEAQEVRGIAPQLGKSVDCNQRQPCHHLIPNGASSAANDNMIKFGPSEDPNSFLWPRVLEGLRLFDIPEEQLHSITAFRLQMARRACFTAELTETGSPRPVFGALIGDSALALNFWPGRGMNSAFTAAQSLARTLAKQWRGLPLRMADFTNHEAAMAALQHRHTDRAWRNVVLRRRGVTLSIASAMEEVMLEGPFEKHWHEQQVVTRMNAFADRLGGRLPGNVNRSALAKKIAALSSETLAVFAECGGWETALSSGPEVDLDQLNPPPLDAVKKQAA